MRIIIVDGNDAARNEITEILGNADPAWECELAGTASDGRAGYDLISAGKPDLVILDIQLSGMNGISMLKKLRANEVHNRVIVITADMDFRKAREAIGLGVDEYLLKPVKKKALLKAVQHIFVKLADERAVETALSLESIFMGCLNGQLHPDRAFNQIVRERYGFSLQDSCALLAIWLGSGYMEYRSYVKRFLEKSCRDKELKICVLPVDSWHLVSAVLYRTGENASDPAGCGQTGEGEKSTGFEPSGWTDEFEEFRDNVIPPLSLSIRGELLCMWAEAAHMEDLPEALKELRRIREWNLIFERGDLIRRADVDNITTVPLKYPVELDEKIRQAARTYDTEEIRKCYYRLYDLFRSDFYQPREIKECMIRFNMTVLSAVKYRYQVISELEIQNSMQRIADAVSWTGIREAMERFFRALKPVESVRDENRELSPLIYQALQMVKNNYDKGITLEEIARNLFVSEEYLSTQFKKETGAGFADTVRRMRMEKIKDLLRNTNLKINQIAEVTGYTDPKYMSRVFKEETGMLPTEYRKSVH